MGRLNLTDNLFIGTQELKVFQDNALQFKTILGYLTKHYGFVKLQDDMSAEQSCWNISLGNNNTFTINAPSYAFAYPNNLIAWNNSARVVTVPSSLQGKYFWVKISYNEDNFEQGTLTLTSEGVVSGNSTLFTERLRGEPNFASVIELFSYDENSSLWISKGQYTVESVSSDTSMILSTVNGLPDVSLSYLYKVVGTFPIGTLVSSDMKYPFVYDSCNIECVAETVENQAPNEAVMMVSNEEFYIARMELSSNGILGNYTSQVDYFEDTTLFDEMYSKWWSLK